MMKKLLMVMTILILSSCTHHINMQGFSHTTQGVEGLKGKKILLYLKNIPEKVSTSSDGNTYHFDNLRETIKVASMEKFSGVVKSITLIGDYDGVLGDFDYLLTPHLSIRSTNDFWTIGCLITYGLTIRDSKKRVITKSKREKKRKAVGRGSLGPKCRLVMEEIFDGVTDEAVGKLPIRN